MARTVTVEQLANTIAKTLDEYEAGVIEDMTAVVKKVTREGVKTIKSNAGVFGGTGQYAKGWTSQVETGRLSAQGIIYNKAVPGLPHLLEFGHANRGGGRTPGRVHIAPVEKAIVESFQKEMEQTL